MSAPLTSEKPVALVTGASSGIGAATACAMAKAGTNVAIHFNANEVGADAILKICQSYGVDACTLQGDISKDEDCRVMIDVVTERWGRLDVLINNAGMTRFADASDLDALDTEDFEEIFSVNVSGAYQMTRAAVRLLKSANGSVVNVSSHAGFSGIGSSMAYAASKGALNTLTLSLARSLAPDVRVNAVCPGFVDTDWMAPKLDPDDLAAFKRQSADIAPLQRIVLPEEVAEAALWFAFGGKSITGQLLVIDAGTHLTVGAPL